MAVVEDLHAGELQLHADGDRHEAADHAGDHGEHEVHRADVLVVGRIDEAAPPGRGVVLVCRVVVVCAVSRRSHYQFLEPVVIAR